MQRYTISQIGLFYLKNSNTLTIIVQQVVT